jgi:hypothetical protein
MIILCDKDLKSGTVSLTPFRPEFFDCQSSPGATDLTTCYAKHVMGFPSQKRHVWSDPQT